MEKQTGPVELRPLIDRVMKGYPELSDIVIEFKWGHIAQKSFMLAQPNVKSLFGPRSQRSYQIIMKHRFFLENPQFEDGRVPEDVIIGWLAHELGHILDYKDRSSWNLMWFGVWYYISRGFLKRAEITADLNAVEHGFAREIILSKEFARNPKYFPLDYIRKLKRYYPSVAKVRYWAEMLNSGQSMRENPR